MRRSTMAGSHLATPTRSARAALAVHDQRTVYVAVPSPRPSTAHEALRTSSCRPCEISTCCQSRRRATRAIERDARQTLARTSFLDGRSSLLSLCSARSSTMRRRMSSLRKAMSPSERSCWIDEVRPGFLVRQGNRDVLTLMERREQAKRALEAGERKPAQSVGAISRRSGGGACAVRVRRTGAEGSSARNHRSRRCRPRAINTERRAARTRARSRRNRPRGGRARRGGASRLDRGSPLCADTARRGGASSAPSAHSPETCSERERLISSSSRGGGGGREQSSHVLPSRKLDRPLGAL